MAESWLVWNSPIQIGFVKKIKAIRIDSSNFTRPAHTPQSLFSDFNPDSPQQSFYSSKTLYCMILQPIYKPSVMIRLTASIHDLRLIIPPCHG